MDIQGYSWAGTPTEDFDGATYFFGQVLGLPTLMNDEDRKIAIFQLPSPFSAWPLMTIPRVRPNRGGRRRTCRRGRSLHFCRLR